jgi:hypothetical protein
MLVNKFDSRIAHPSASRHEHYLDCCLPQIVLIEECRNRSEPTITGAIEQI